MKKVSSAAWFLAASWFGKDHNMPAFAASQAGPFDQWPVGIASGSRSNTEQTT